MVLRLFHTTLSLAVIVGIEALESNLVLWQSTSFPLGAKEAREVNSGELQDTSLREQI